MTDASENIPLRIMLLFMDEVFDLQERNQWLRRQIVSVLRQLVKAMFGMFIGHGALQFWLQTLDKILLEYWILRNNISSWNASLHSLFGRNNVYLSRCLLDTLWSSIRPIIMPHIFRVP